MIHGHEKRGVNGESRMAWAADESNADAAEPASKGAHNEWKQSRRRLERWWYEGNRRGPAWARRRHPSRRRRVDWELAQIGHWRFQRSTQALCELLEHLPVHRPDCAAVVDVQIGDDL